MAVILHYWTEFGSFWVNDVTVVEVGPTQKCRQWTDRLFHSQLPETVTYRADATQDAKTNQQAKVDTRSSWSQQGCDGRQTEKPSNYPLGAKPLSQQTSRDLWDEIAVDKWAENVTLNRFLP